MELVVVRGYIAILAAKEFLILIINFLIINYFCLLMRLVLSCMCQSQSYEKFFKFRNVSGILYGNKRAKCRKNCVILWA